MEVEKDPVKIYLELSNRHQVQYGEDFILPHVKPGMHVLDIGCGTGKLSFSILNVVGEKGSVTAIDPDKERIIQAANEWNGYPNLKFINCRGSQIMGEIKECNKFDLVVSNVVLHWMDDEEKSATLSQMFQLLKASGMVLLQYSRHLATVISKFASSLGLENITEMLYFDQQGQLNDVCEGIGFKIVSSSPTQFSSYWEDTEEFTLFLNAIFHGRFDFHQAYLEQGKPDIELNRREDGCIVYTAPLQRLVMQK